MSELWIFLWGLLAFILAVGSEEPGIGKEPVVAVRYDGLFLRCHPVLLFVDLCDRGNLPVVTKLDHAFAR